MSQAVYTAEKEAEGTYGLYRNGVRTNTWKSDRHPQLSALLAILNKPHDLSNEKNLD